MPAPPRYSDQGGIPSAPGALPLPSTELGSDAPNLNNTPYGSMSQGGTMAPSGEIPAGYPAPSGIHQPAAPANADATAPIGGLPDLGAPQQ